MFILLLQLLMRQVDGQPGYFLRLLDIPKICPHISFTLPWSQQKRVKIVALKDFWMDVVNFTVPEPPKLDIRDPHLVKKPTRRKKARKPVHIGPVCVRYETVRIGFGEYQLVIDNMSGTLQKEQSNYSETVPWGNQINHREDDITIHQLLEKHILSIFDPGKNIHIRIRRTNETFNVLYNPNKKNIFRPWIEIIDFPISLDQKHKNTSGLVGKRRQGILESTSLFPGLRMISSGCDTFQCVMKEVCSKQNCCKYLLGHSLLLFDQYPQEYTQNFIAFSRKNPCPGTVPFSEGCSTGWRRYNYSCYLLVSKQSTWHQANSDCQILRSGLSEVTTNLSDMIDWRGSAWTWGNGSYCTYLDTDGNVQEEDCSRQLPKYLCEKPECASCCKLTYAEYEEWGRRVLGISVILRPSTKPEKEGKGNLSLKIAYSVILSTIAFVIVYRLVIRKLENRRYRLQFQ